MNYVDIKIPFDYIEANIIINHLRQQEIDCFLKDTYSTTAAIAPLAVSTKIMVAEKDLARAKKIVEEFFSKD
jgi:hypothetical protein